MNISLKVKLKVSINTLVQRDLKKTQQLRENIHIEWV